MKKRLLLSILSLLLSLAMLTGTTFAWFTDTVSSGHNRIVAGNLDIALYNGSTPVTENTLLFDEITYWEPGVVAWENLTVANEGTLALSYDLQVGLEATTVGGRSLAEVLKVAVVEQGVTATDRNALLSSISQWQPLETFSLSAPLLPGESEAFGIVIYWQPGDTDNLYNLADPLSLQLGVVLTATQLPSEADSFGSDYDAAAGAVTRVTRDSQVLSNVKTDLPENGIAASRGVVFATAPYAYTDTALFAGKHIVKLGIPVKTVKALDENQTFTLSVVKTASNAYEYVSQLELKLPLEQLGSFTTVNKWVYVDVDLQLGPDETLAFGMPTDTVEWGYLTAKKAPYYFRSANGSWSQINNASILFDIITREELVFEPTEHGLAMVTQGQVLPKVLTAFPESAIPGGNDVSFVSPPYAYTNQTLFGGKRITRIGIPVKTVKALDEHQTFTLSVVKQNAHPYQVVSQHVLELPLEQLGSSTTVNNWVYVDVDLQLAQDETLAFGGRNDTVTWAWKSSYSDTAYRFRNVNQNWNQYSCGIFFDVYAETVYTYAQYQQELKAEQERLEAEQAQQRLDEALQKVLGGRKLSILGDSISTYTGYSNNTACNSTIGGNAIYYNGSRDGFTAVNETWWMQTLSRSGMELLVNNSWSGDTVTGRGISRSLQLHNNEGQTPDIIAVYLGINDFRTKVTAAAFAEKYDEMISGMKAKYPNAEVYLFTLVYTTNVNSGVSPDDVVYFNDAIKATAQKYGCTLVDLYGDSGINKTNLSTYMGDGKLHPNYAGMDLITQCFLDALCEAYLSS